MSPDDDEPYTDPIRGLRDSHSIWLNAVNGVPWATNSYWAIEVPDRLHPLAVTLNRYNIDFDQPAAIHVYETLVLNPEGEPQDIKGKVLDKLPEGAERVERHCINDSPVFLWDDNYERLLALYDLPGGKLGLLNRQLLRMVEQWTHSAEWWAGPDPTKPFLRKRDGRVIGVLMPMHHIVNGTAK